MNLMLLVSFRLGRKLLPYEEQIFKFPRACVVCHESNTKVLTDCKRCPVASFCQEHFEDPSHEKLCRLFSLCFDLDIAATVFARQAPRNIVPYHTETAYLPASIEIFINLYIKEDRSLSMCSGSQTAHISEYLTRPLTLLYAMEQLKYSPDTEMTIHIIGANMIEVDSLEVWEMLLHWLPSLTTLKIILVGPELCGRNGNLQRSICDCCNEKGLKLNFQTYSMLYKEYVDGNCFVKPDIIVGYNVGIAECENEKSPNNEWADSLRVLPDQKCPFILTSYTSGEACKEHERLSAVLEKSITYIYCDKNPFSSFRPHRDYETEGVYYQNQYVIIYPNLE